MLKLNIDFVTTYCIAKNVFNVNLTTIHKIKGVLTRNKPAHVGRCILKLSKTLMHKFPYDYIKNKYGNTGKLLLTDTNSFSYEIKTCNLYEDFYENKDNCDSNNYSGNSKYYYMTNNLFLEKLKMKQKEYQLLSLLK